MSLKLELSAQARDLNQSKFKAKTIYMCTRTKCELVVRSESRESQESCDGHALLKESIMTNDNDQRPRGMSANIQYARRQIIHDVLWKSRMALYQQANQAIGHIQSLRLISWW